ncbi:LicD family protein, partial [Christensenellaceae bacterium OttesenSCG-928-M15]|nr:LicD family protein [Christensenellaceae bacterium OttesenSCG-928-M15]
VCKTELDGCKFFFQDHTTDPHYRWGWGRIRRNGSEFVRVGQEHLKMRTGIFLDVFPLDNVPDFAPARGLFTLRCFLYRKLLYSEVGRVSAKKGWARVVYWILSKVPVAWVFRQLDRLQAHNASDTKYTRILTFPTPKGRPFGYLRCWYVELAEIAFEGQAFCGIEDFDGYLTYKFGNYMIEPPETQRHWHPVVSFKLPEGDNVCI